MRTAAVYRTRSKPTQSSKVQTCASAQLVTRDRSSKIQQSSDMSLLHWRPWRRPLLASFMLTSWFPTSVLVLLCFPAVSDQLYMLLQFSQLNESNEGPFDTVHTVRTAVLYPTSHSSRAEVNAWNYTSTPPTHLHGMVLRSAQGQLYLHLHPVYAACKCTSAWIDWSIDWLIDWLIDRSTDRFVGRRMGWGWVLLTLKLLMGQLYQFLRKGFGRRRLWPMWRYCPGIRH
jgi:hypothetical protein